MNDVSSLVRKRVKEGSRPGERCDDARLGLVIEGGGMRGVVSGAMTAALQNLGMSDVFDCVLGASAGAMAGAFFVAGDSPAGTTVYYEHINNRKFINIGRIFSSRPVLDLEFLVGEIFRTGVPLEYEKILRSRIDLCVIATDLADGKKAVLRNFTEPQEIATALRASACNPIVAGPPVEFRGRKFWDAALSESIPVEAALELGCTHLVVLRTRSNGEIRSPTGKLERMLARWFVGSLSVPAFESYCAKHESYVRELDLIEQLGGKCLAIYPTLGASISQLETGRRKLIYAAIDGYMAGLNAFGVTTRYVGPSLSHF